MGLLTSWRSGRQAHQLVRFVIPFCAATLFTVAGLAKEDRDSHARNTRPKLVLQASPQVGMSPARVVVRAELVGGADDFEEYYCPTVQWGWGDDTTSETTVDCTPYEAGKTEIKRRFIVERVYRHAGLYQISFRLKRHDKLLATASAMIEIRAGVRDSG